jgi:hypothetical protein
MAQELCQKEGTEVSMVVRDDIALADRVSSFLLPPPSSFLPLPPLTLLGDILNFGMAQELCQKEGIRYPWWS